MNQHVNRRSLVTATGSVALAPVLAELGAPDQGRATSNDRGARSAVASLIDRHRAAVDATDEAVIRLNEIERNHHLPQVRVQYGVLRGMDDEKPLYAYSERELAEKLAPSIKAHRSFWAGRQDVLDKMDRQHAKLFAELRELQARRDEAEVATGLRAAAEHSERCSDMELAARRSLCAHKPATLAEVVAVLAYMLDGMNQDAMLFEEEDVIRFARALTGVQEA